MDPQFNKRSIERARWSNDVADALVEAERLLGQLGDRADPVVKASLKLRLQLVRAELNSLNRVTPVESRLVDDSAWPNIQLGGAL